MGHPSPAPLQVPPRVLLPHVRWNRCFTFGCVKESIAGMGVEDEFRWMM